MLYAVKLALSALIIVAVSEISKRSTLWASLLVSLPLVTILSFCWIYMESKDVGKIAAMSRQVLVLVLPSLLLFIALPLLLDKGINFWLALVLASVLPALAYGIATRWLSA